MARKIVFMALLFVAGAMFAYACCAEERPVMEQAAQVNENELRSLLQRNFDASNAENLKLLMETIHSQAPGRKWFPREVSAVFKRTDIYTRLDEFEVTRVDFKGTYAEARVVQTTIPKTKEDRLVGNVHFQTNSAMLPKHETVWYKMAFQQEANGEWKIYKMVWSPEPLPLRRDSNDPQDQAEQIIDEQNAVIEVGGGCPDGNCQFPSRSFATRPLR